MRSHVPEDHGANLREFDLAPVSRDGGCRATGSTTDACDIVQMPCAAVQIFMHSPESLVTAAPAEQTVNVF